MADFDITQLDNPISINFVQGDDVTIEVQWQDDQDNPVDLTGSTITSSLRKEYDTPVLASFTIDHSDLATGKFTMTLPGSVTSQLPTRRNSRVTSFVFDINIVYPNTQQETPVYGYLKMTRQVTE